MATGDIKIGIDIVSNTKEETKDVLKLKQTYQEVQKIAGSTGGTAGSRAVAAKASPASSGLSGQAYGQAQGVTGMGSGARDFAKEAQGLGGLVRLYATYAANLFAVSAAFGALKNAADTSNLVKGLDQLGARSGVALGTLSQRLVEVTDGAISMREAMEAVTKATSSGLSSKQVLELGKVAKTASQALGVSMEDAVSRLTRGITKLEPELLDELGIFTKIDPAVQKYAQSIGRAANSLTDFERRQAFAIAVLDEGNKKFGELDLDANPYAKFLAQLKNVSQTVLEVVNTAVIPLVEYLSKSPTALLTVLGGIATIIVRQALPAFGQLKAGLESAAESAQKKSIQRAEDAKVAQLSIAESVKKAADARVEAEVSKVVAAESKINDIKNTSVKKQSALYKILEKDLENITEKDLKRIDTTAKGLDTRGLKDQAQAYRDTAQGIRDYQREKTNYDAALKREEIQLQKNAKWWSIESITIETAEAAKRQAIRASIISNAAYQASLVGVARAMIAVNAAIVEQGIVGWSALTLRVKAGAAAIGGALATLGGAINKFLGVLGVLVTAYSIFDGLLDGASEQVGKFDSAVDKAKSSAETLNKTYEQIYKNDPFSAQSVQARGNALMEVADGFQEIAKTAREAEVAIKQSTWAKFKEEIGISGVNRNFGKGIATQLTSVLKNLDDPAAKKSLEDAARSQLGITELSFDNIVKAARKLGASAPEIKKLEDAIVGVATQAKIAGVASATFAESYLKVTDQIAKINQKFAVNDDLAMFAINSGNALTDLDTLLSQGINKSVSGLVTALEGIGKGANIFGSMSGELIPLIDTAKSFSKEFSEGAKEVRKLSDELEDLKTKKVNQSTFTSISAEGATTFDQAGFDNAVKELERQRGQTASELAKAQLRTDKAKTELEKVAAKVQETLPRALADSTNLLGVRLASQLSKTNNQVQQGAYASFDAIPELVAKSSQLKLQEIDTQIANTKALRDLTTATVLSAAQQKVTSAENSLGSASDASKPAALAKLDTAKSELSLLETAVKDPLKALKLLATEQENNTELGKRLGIQVKDLAARTVEYTSALRQQEQQRLSEQLQGSIAVTNARFKREQDLLKLKQDEIKLTGEQLSLQAQQENIGLDTKEQLNNQIALNRENQADLAYKQKLLDIERNINVAYTNASQLNPKDKVTAITKAQGTYAANVSIVETQKAQDIEKARLDLLKAQSAIVIERINREEASYVRSADFAKVAVDSALQLKQISLDTQLGVQATLLNNAQLAETAKTEIEYQSSLKLAALEAERTKIQANQEFERQGDINTFAMRKILAADTAEEGVTPETVRKLAEITEQEKKQKATRDAAITQADSLYNKNVSIANAVRLAGNEQTRFNELLDNSSRLADSLRGAFGDVGAALGSLAETFTKISISSEQGAKALAQIGDAAKAAKAAGKDDDALALEKAYEKQKQKNAKTELDGNLKILSGTKALFKEKSSGYKLIGGIEKSIHMASLAMKATEMIADGTLTVTSIGNSLARAGGNAVEAITAAFAAPFPVDFIAGAAMIGVMSSLLGSAFGGGHADIGFSPNSQQRQEVAGTGMSYDAQGNKVETGGGVFGDSGAKSESIAKSLEILTTQGVEGLDYDKGLLKAFQKLSDSLTHAAEVIYAIPGLRMGGTDFGTQAGTSTTGPGGVIGGALDSLGLGGVFGGSITASSSIESAGIQLRGSLQDFIDGTQDSITKYKDVVTQFHKDGGWFSKDQDWPKRHREMAQVGKDVKDALRDVFINAKDVMTQIGGKVGTGVGIINDAFKHIDFKGIEGDIDSMGLTGQAALDQLNAVVGKKLDETAKTVFPYFNDFKKFGEGYLQTVIRVQDGNDKVSQSLTAMGIQSKIAGNYVASEYLIKIAGGLDKLRSQSDYFTSTFLTDAQRLKPIQKGVTDQLVALGLSSSLTKDQFVELVQAQDVSTESGADLYQSLMDLAPGFNTVREAEAKALKLSQDNWNSFFDKFAGDTNKATKNADDITRVFSKFNLQIPKTKTELYALVERLRKIAPDTADAITSISGALDTYYNSANSFENVTISLSNSLKATSDTLKSQIKTLKDYNTALLLGSQSTLTTSDQYSVAKDQVARLTSIIQGAANTPDEIKARNDAISSFSSASDTFLKLSGTLFGSSAQYIDDFNLIRSTVISTTAALEAQQSDAEKQLTALTTANSFLLDIKNSTKTTSDYLAAYLAAGGVKLPGFASGTNYVPYDMTAEIHQGERIIPAADNAVLIRNTTNNAAQTQELVNQIVNLTKQVEELAAVVADGAILNAKATDRNTQEITKVISNANDKAIQSNRLQAKASIK